MQQRAPKAVPLLIATILVATAAFAAQRAHACGMQKDFLVRADPLLASVRPADCATLLDAAPQFTWPLQRGRNLYTVALRFPDGHVEKRATRSNWLAWDRALPAGEYTWRVSVAGAQRNRSAARLFRVEKPRKPEPAAKEAAAPAGNAREAGTSAPAANLFRLEPSESWIPSARPSKSVPRASVGGFFGGFTE